MTTSDKNLGEILKELASSRGLTAEKISELTNVPKRYVSALFENDSRNLPAEPYVRGYLIKFASVLGVEPEPLHESYHHLDLRKSGREDFLPKNRFALAKSRKGMVIVAVVFLSIGYFASTRLNATLGIPSVEINIPARIDDRDFIETREQIFTVEGKIDAKDSIVINNEPIPVDGIGRFSKEIVLDKGLNTFEITVKRFLGRETTIIRKVFYIVDETEENANKEQEIEEQIPTQGESAE